MDVECDGCQRKFEFAGDFLPANIVFVVHCAKRKHSRWKRMEFPKITFLCAECTRKEKANKKRLKMAKSANSLKR